MTQDREAELTMILDGATGTLEITTSQSHSFDLERNIRPNEDDYTFAVFLSEKSDTYVRVAVQKWVLGSEAIDGFPVYVDLSPLTDPGASLAFSSCISRAL